MDDKIASLKLQIARAFADVPSPGDDVDDLVVTFGAGEGEDIADAFRGRHWKDMPLDLILENFYFASSLTHMTPQAFHYYLPGFLLLLLDRPDSEPDGPTLWNLAPPEPDPELENIFAPKDLEGKPLEPVMPGAFYEYAIKKYRERMGLLSPAQRKAVLAFLDFQGKLATDEEEPAIRRAITSISGLG